MIRIVLIPMLLILVMYSRAQVLPTKLEITKVMKLKTDRILTGRVEMAGYLVHMPGHYNIYRIPILTGMSTLILLRLWQRL